MSSPLSTALANDKPFIPRRVYRNFEGTVKVALVPNSLVTYLDKNNYGAFAFKDESIEEYKNFYLNKLKDDIVKENYRNFNHRTPRSQVLEKFVEDSKSELKNLASNKVRYADINIDELNLEVLETAFQILPSSTSNDIHLGFIMSILPLFSKALLIDDDKIDYSLRHRFFERFSYFILNRETKYINKFIQPFVDNFSNSREMASFFQELISTEDKVNKYEQFWSTWESFYDQIVTMCNNKTSKYYLSEIVHNYLLAWPYWNETAKEWHSLKDREKVFYKKVSKDIGQCPSVLYSISKLLNEIGSGFFSDGIFWISGSGKVRNNADNFWD